MLFAIAVHALGSAGSASPTASPSVRFTATDGTIAGSAFANAGILRVQLEHVSREARWMGILDATAIDRRAYRSGAGAIPEAAIVGRRHRVGAGSSVDLTVVLPPGHYLVAALAADRVAVEFATPLRVSQ